MTNVLAVVPDTTLAQWYAQALADAVTAQQPFSAYNVTEAVRKAHPGNNVPHGDTVKSWVHRAMDGLMQIGQWGSTNETRQSDGATYILYSPVQIGTPVAALPAAIQWG